MSVPWVAIDEMEDIVFDGDGTGNRNESPACGEHDRGKDDASKGAANSQATNEAEDDEAHRVEKEEYPIGAEHQFPQPNRIAAGIGPEDWILTQSGKPDQQQAEGKKSDGRKQQLDANPWPSSAVLWAWPSFHT